MASHLVVLVLSVLYLQCSQQCSVGGCAVSNDSSLVTHEVQIKQCWVTQEDNTAADADSHVDNGACQDIFKDECKVDFESKIAVTGCTEEWTANIRETLHYANTTHYTVVLEWDSYPGASSYDVTVYGEHSEGCTAQTNRTSVTFKLRFSPPDKRVKVVPKGTCVVASTLLQNNPQNCFPLCHDCSCLNHFYRSTITPENIQTCVYGGHGDEKVLRVQWEQLHYPRRVFLNESVHLAIENHDVIVSEVVEVKGQTTAYVRLRGLLLDVHYIKVQQFLCDIEGVNRKVISNSTCSESLPLFPSSCSTPIQPTSAIIKTLAPAIHADIDLNIHHSALDPRNATSSVVDLTYNQINSSPSLRPEFGKHVTEGNLKDLVSSSTQARIDTHHTIALNSATGRDQIPLIALALTGVAFGILFPFLLFTIAAVFTVKKYRFYIKHHKVKKLSIEEKGIQRESSRTVLVLFSQASSFKDEMSVMKNVVKGVSLYSGVHCLYFDKPSVRTSVAEWVEGAIKRSDKVLLVVNKEFVKEWDSLKAYLPHGESLIYVARQVVDSFVMRDKQQLSKFALVFLRKEDQRSLLKDSLYLQTVKSFLVSPQAVAELEGLVRFILDVPTYTLL